MRKRVSSFIIILLISILINTGALALIPPPIASAHAFVIGSDPVDGSTITRRPEVVRIWFNAPISPLSQASVYAARQGQLINMGTGPAYIPDDKPQELVIPLQTPDKLSEGSYQISWSAIAQDDGHITYGIIGFNIGFSSTGLSGEVILGPSTSNRMDEIRALDFDHFPAIFLVLWEWFTLLSLACWLGIVVMESGILAMQKKDLLARTRQHTYSVQWLCLFIMLAGELVTFFLRVFQQVLVQYKGIFSFSLLTDLLIESSYGRIWLLRIGMVLLIMGFLYGSHLLKSLPPAPPPEGKATKDTEPALPGWRERFSWLLSAGVLTLLSVLTSPAQVLQPRPSALFFSWLQLIALGIWAGCFYYLIAILWPLLHRQKQNDLPETKSPLPRYLMPLLLVSITLQLLSSFFLSDSSISDPGQLLNDPYGQVLLVHLGLLLLMTLFSGYVLFVLRLRPAHTDAPEADDHHIQPEEQHKSLRLAGQAISALGAGVFLCMALMSYLAPPIVFPAIDYSAQETATNTLQQTKQMGDLTVTFTVLPGRMGTQNTAILLITDANGEPVTNATVQLNTNMPAMDMGKGQATIEGGTPTYVVTFDQQTAFNMVGLWEIIIEIQLPGQPTLQETFHIEQTA